MKRRIAAVGRLLPWREADLARWFKDAASGPLEREWEIRRTSDRVPEAEGGDVSLHEEAHAIGHYFGVDGQLYEIYPRE